MDCAAHRRLFSENSIQNEGSAKPDIHTGSPYTQKFAPQVCLQKDDVGMVSCLQLLRVDSGIRSNIVRRVTGTTFKDCLPAQSRPGREEGFLPLWSHGGRRVPAGGIFSFDRLASIPAKIQEELRKHNSEWPSSYREGVAMKTRPGRIAVSSGTLAQCENDNLLRKGFWVGGLLKSYRRVAWIFLPNGAAVPCEVAS